MSPVSEIIDVVRVCGTVLDAMLAEARRQPHTECCGLLAGRAGVISVVLPAHNALASSTAYEIAPAELFSFFRRMREERLDHLGIYHSHPHSNNEPSPSDLERALYPDVAYFIISPSANAPQPVRAFRIAGGRAAELRINCIS
jgi:proteasome lid subunit RPN8/RPN11